MKTTIKKTIGLLFLAAVVVVSCSKEGENTPHGTDECWYSITLDNEIAGPNRFGQDNIILTSSYGTYDGEEEGGLSTGNFGFKTNYGATVRYGGIGLALDYFPGKVKSSYQSHEGSGEAKFKNNMFQIKVSLTL